MTGLILIDKPPDCTSHDVVLRLRRVLGEARLGHFGTLDPMATGLLVVAAGKAPRLFNYFSKQEKTYLAGIRLGLATDTYDAQGTPQGKEASRLPDRTELVRALSRFEGEIQQVPPPFSAKKFQGRPYYKLARAGRETPRVSRPVVVRRFALLDYHPPLAEVEIVCASGTYVRSLAHDVGGDLGCGAHLAALRRVRSGDFSVEEAHSLDQVQAWIYEGRTDKFLLPLESVLAGWPRADLTETGLSFVRHGRPVGPDVTGPDSVRPSAGEPLPYRSGEPYRLFGPEGRLVALARADRSRQLLNPFLLLD
jgi:tRNA pseudouridine55 synthase